MGFAGSGVIVRSRRSSLRAAAKWFACMRGPKADGHRRAFERWLSADASHRDAYSRVSEAFSLAITLRTIQVAPSKTPKRQQRHPERTVFVVAAVAFACLAVTGSLLPTFALKPALEMAAAPHMRSTFETRTGEIRTIRLPDGSSVTLDTDTELAAAYRPDRRDLWLRRGRTRFEVAHDGRPFVVHAGGGTIVAHGTVFDVRVGDDGASVTLLRGVIDVQVAVAVHGPSLRRLAPGDAVAYNPSYGISIIPTPKIAEIVQPTWPSALLDFDRIPVAALAAEANRYSATKLVVIDPRVSQTQVSGTFRMGDTARLANDLSLLLNVKVQKSARGEIQLQAR